MLFGAREKFLGEKHEPLGVVLGVALGVTEREVFCPPLFCSLPGPCLYVAFGENLDPFGVTLGEEEREAERGGDLAPAERGEGRGGIDGGGGRGIPARLERWGRTK